MPLIPILLAVIVLGLAFGAGLSVLTQREANAPTALVTAAASPSLTPAARLSPKRFAQSVPAHGPRATPSTAATRPAVPIATPRRVAVALASPSAEPILATPPEIVAPHATPAPVTPNPTRAPASVRSPAPTATIPSYAVVATVQPRAAPTDEADSDFARLSAGVVRAYFAALARGDDASALAALDPSKRRDLGEREFVDSSLRIVSLDAHGTGDSATVNVDLSTTKGAYFEQFYLHRTSTGAALIVEHTYIKP